MTAEKGVGLRGWLLGPETRDPRVQKPEPSDSLRIAVLPMANISPNPRDAYFADGLTEELISTISKISGLNVISRTSVMQYRGLGKAAKEIGLDLAVSAILEGSVRKAGERLRITAKLIDTQNDQHLWSETYDRELKDAFQVQTDIATNIAASLRITLLKADKEKISKKPTENMRAYSWYLKGRHSWSERTEESVRKGAEYLQRAIQEDPKFALAYSDLAICYEMTEYGSEPSYIFHGKAIDCANRALELDPSLSEAHAALRLANEGNYEWKMAHEEFVKAVELDPKNSNVRHWYAHNFRHRGRLEDAIAEWRKALENDPFSIPVRSSLGFALVISGSVDEGLKLAQSGVQLDDSSLYAHMCLGNAYAAASMRPQTLEEASTLSHLAHEFDFNYKAHAASLYAIAGRNEEALEIQKQMLEQSEHRYVDPCLLGMMYAAVGDQANAIAQLKKAVKSKSGWVSYVNQFPAWKSMRDNPRFAKILRQVGLE